MNKEIKILPILSKCTLLQKIATVVHSDPWHFPVQHLKQSTIVLTVVYYCILLYATLFIIILTTYLGISSCVLALGFEKMEKGSLQGKVSVIYVICTIHLLLKHSDYNRIHVQYYDLHGHVYFIHALLKHPIYLFIY